jgi:carbamoyl-phosphate synthase small subunit
VKDLTPAASASPARTTGLRSKPHCPPTATGRISLFDGTLQGLARTDKPAFCFQATQRPDPNDISYLFDRFITLMAQSQEKKNA